MQAGTKPAAQQEAESRWQGFAVEQQSSMYRWGQRPSGFTADFWGCVSAKSAVGSELTPAIRSLWT